MRTLLPLAVVAACLAFTTAASAERKPNKPAPASSDDLCETTGQSTKRCYIHGDSAELHLKISRDYPILLTLDELPRFAYDDPYIQNQVTNEFVIFKLRKDNLPKGHSLILRSETMTITLYFDEVRKGGDSQVHIQRADRGSQNREVESRVAARVAELEAEHKNLLSRLDARAERLARKQFLNAVHEDGSQVGEPGGEVRSREDFLVFRATQVVRIGKERLLLVSIEERKGDLFSIGQFSASVTQGGAKRSLDVDYRCAQMSVRPGKTVRCTLSLGAIDKRKGRALVNLKLVGADGQRAVALSAVNIL